MGALMQFVCVNRSKKVSEDDVQKMARAVELICNAPDGFCAAWGIDPIAVMTRSDPSEHPNAVLCEFVDVDEGDGTLAWHAELKGRPIIRVDVLAVLKFGGGVLDDRGGTNLSVSAAFQHEVFETLIDRFANAYVAMPDGRFLAIEVGDPVEAFTRWDVLEDGTRVHGSDACTPAYFIEDAPPPYDLDASVAAPFENDGYQITVGADAHGALVARADICGTKYTANKLAFRTARIEAGRGRGVSRL